MSTPNTSHSNPYAVTTGELADQVDMASSAPLLTVDDRTNVGGRLWWPCRQAVHSDRLELKFLTVTWTIPTTKIRLLRSGGKGSGRHLEIIHDDELVSPTIQLIPLYPARWYGVFESLGIATEDETDLRDSSQLSHRCSVWITTAESMFWTLWIVLIFTVPIVAAVVNLIRGYL